MPLAIGTRIGAYEVTGLVGAGGMGEVYRARDVQLNRDVAVKVLPPAVAADPDRLARFVREAQTLGVLNHPNIAQLYGFESAATALVMELVPGDDLSALIARGPIAAADALPIARQIADALEAAHERGIIHRDLKPANVKVRDDGTVKVLDFGLAKALTSDSLATSADAMNSPTLTNRATQLGMILGTAAYMAPEQAKGRAADKRADIWAFGVVLYEMLSGKRAFEGQDASTTMAAVLMKDPDWSALPASTPPALRRLIHRCLERDPKLRLRDIGEARILLNDADVLKAQPALGPLAPQPPSRGALTPWILAGVTTVLAAVALAFTPFGGVAPAAPLVQFTVAFPPNVRPLSNGTDYNGGIISPDGRLVAFSGADAKTGRIAIYVRRVDALEATMIKGTDGGRYPFWAPSSSTIAFYAKGKLNRVDIDGSSPLVICDAPTGGWGGSWNDDDVIITGVRDPGPIVKVSAKGGDKPTPVTKIEAGRADHDWPQFLPDGRHFLYTSWGTVVTGSTAYYVGSLDSPDTTLLREELNQVHSMAFAAPGFVLFIREGSLMAQRLDTSKLELQGDPIAVVANAGGPIIASANGALSYTTTQMATVWNRLATINRDGTDERPLVEPGFYADPAISPNGLWIAYARRDSAGAMHDIWIRDMTTGAERRFTLDAADDRSPVWSPDSNEIVWSSLRQPAGLYRKQANGAGAETLITGKDFPQSWSYQWHPNGFITSHSDVGTSYNIWNVSLKDFKTTPLVNSPIVNEARGSVSPDGRWLAYDARETSRFEVFVDTYPPSGTKLPVTSEGGAEAKWSKDGKELYYVNSATGALMVVPVTPGNPPTFGTHRQVHPGPLDYGWNSSHSFDIDPKTGRLAIELISAPAALTVMLNWQAAIRK